MNTAVKPSPPSISRTFYLPELTLCPQEMLILHALPQPLVPSLQLSVSMNLMTLRPHGSGVIHYCPSVTALFP